jgi:hypothetical protein
MSFLSSVGARRGRRQQSGWLFRLPETVLTVYEQGALLYEKNDNRLFCGFMAQMVCALLSSQTRILLDRVSTRIWTKEVSA